ncbi:MAG: YlxR family protein [Clostridium sp.]|jgi:predicted RNA-binding protein YlxR (DUF448 family)|nr:YlxR family protein [Clostridium sp.]
MKKKKIPMRMCIGCQEMKPKKELLRVVKNKENEISIDFVGKKPGRGAYICKEVECFDKARRNNGFERAFETSIDSDIYEALKKELETENDK